MNVNYQQILDDKIRSIEIENENGKEPPTLLLHSCCAPCSSYVLEYLSKYFRITILYYNPNISEEVEYQKRVEEMKRLLVEQPAKYSVQFVEGAYHPADYENAIKGLEMLGERSQRCYACYKLRLEYAAQYAKQHDFDYFTTTLSISPHKNAIWLNEIGEQLSDTYDIAYLYADFKKKNGYKRSIELSAIYHLYRQDFCGCSYSKEERHQK
ncbi:MAG: epoxyqueuosine reductase QueH [Eubacteriales bacterium]|nr:epoxyqueuosine reductase QueH [Eubacteriales bacterium]